MLLTAMSSRAAWRDNEGWSSGDSGDLFPPPLVRESFMQTSHTLSNHVHRNGNTAMNMRCSMWATLGNWTGRHHLSRTRSRRRLHILPTCRACLADGRQATAADVDAVRASISTLVGDHPLDVLLQKRMRPRTPGVRKVLNRNVSEVRANLCDDTTGAGSSP